MGVKADVHLQDTISTGGSAVACRRGQELLDMAAITRCIIGMLRHYAAIAVLQQHGRTVVTRLSSDVTAQVLHHDRAQEQVLICLLSEWNRPRLACLTNHEHK